jgi:hypothetical protein
MLGMQDGRWRGMGNDTAFNVAGVSPDEPIGRTLYAFLQDTRPFALPG